MRKKAMILLCGLALIMCTVGTAAAQDADGDGVLDVDDACPGTPAGWGVDGCGCRARPWFRVQTSHNMFGVVIEQGGTPTTINSTSFDFQSYVRTPAGGPTPGGAGADDAFRIYWTFSGGSEKAWFRVYNDGTVQVWDDSDVTASGTTEGKTHDAQGGATHNSPHTTAGAYPGRTITVTMLPDEDNDGVLDADDFCPATAACAVVDADGCPDDDLDGVIDPCDLCSHTPEGAPVDASGCSTATIFYPLSERSVDQEGGLLARQWADYNNDGFSDMLGSGYVYTNQQDGSFVTEFMFPAYSPRGTVGDYNNDGLIDWSYMVAGGNPPQSLYLNNGDETWTNRNDLFVFVYPGVPRNSNGQTCVDLNGDGYLDTYMTGWWDSDPNSFDVIYTSYSDGVSEPCWSKTWEEPSPYANPHMIKGVTPCDFDEDGDQDVYASGYWYTHCFLWRNDGFDGYTGLTDVTAAYDADSGPGGAAGHTQGSCWADFDNDGHFDLFVANFAHAGNTELRFAQNDGPPNFHFTHKGKSGVTQREPLSCGIAGDYDNDGDVDLLVTMSGQYTWQYVELYSNDGNWNFTNTTAAVGLGNQGPEDVGAWGDYNNDGYLDLIAATKLWRNPGGSNHWIKVRLFGGPHPDGLVNGAAIGAQVRITVPGLGTLVRQVEGNTGQLGAQNDSILHFGLASHTDPVDLEIDWPNGYQETVYGVAVDQLHTITLTAPAPTGPPCWEYTTQCHGDCDGSGAVDTVDWPIFRDSFGYAYGTAEYNPCGDLDQDGDVDTADWPEFRDNFGFPAAADCPGGGTWPPTP